MSTAFPLPIVWSVRLVAMQWVVNPPMLRSGVLLVRVRKELFRVRASDGEMLARSVIDPDIGRGLVCLGHEDSAIVDIDDAGHARSEIVAVDVAGHRPWPTRSSAAERQLALGEARFEAGGIRRRSWPDTPPSGGARASPGS